MKSEFEMKTIGSGMGELIKLFCEKNKLKSPLHHTYDFNERIPYGRWLKKLSYIDQQYNQEGLGLNIATYCNASHIGICAYLAESCSNLSEFMSLPSKYINLWYDQSYKNIDISNQTLSISWNIPDYYNKGLFVRETNISEELKIAIIYQRIIQMTNIQRDFIKEINFYSTSPKNLDFYENYFGCNVHFNRDKLKIVIDREVYNIPLRKDPVLFEILKKQADLMLNLYPINKDFIDLVNYATLKAINKNDPRINIVADYLNMSPRLLQIELQARNLCFQNILRNVRLNVAKKYLESSDLSISDISTKLGYKDQTSFNRIFKSLTGQTPMQWKEGNKG